jgi:hypothetical protein
MPVGMVTLATIVSAFVAGEPTTAVLYANRGERSTLAPDCVIGAVLLTV